MHKYGKRDANQLSIISDLRRLGCTVLDLASVGSGCPDILVGNCGVNYLFEIKTRHKPAWKISKLTADQIDFFKTWDGQKARIETVEQAIKIIRSKPL